MTPLFIVLAIYIYLEDMFEKERNKRKNMRMEMNDDLLNHIL